MKWNQNLKLNSKPWKQALSPIDLKTATAFYYTTFDNKGESQKLQISWKIITIKYYTIDSIEYNYSHGWGGGIHSPNHLQ